MCKKQNKIKNTESLCCAEAPHRLHEWSNVFRVACTEPWMGKEKIMQGAIVEGQGERCGSTRPALCCAKAPHRLQGRCKEYRDIQKKGVETTPFEK